MDVLRIICRCDDILAENSKDSGALFVKGSVFLKIGNYKKCIEVLNELSKIDPEYPGLWVLKANVYTLLREKKMAILAKKRAEEIQAEQYPVPETPGAVCEACGNSAVVGGEKCPSCGVDAGGSAEGSYEEIEERITVEGRSLGADDAPSGREMRKGLVNGLAKDPGKVGVTTYRIVDGFRSVKSGLTNGVTNGLGFTNGLGGGRFSSEAKARRWKVLIIPLIAVALLMSPLLGPVGEEYVGMGSIRIDGDFGDWSDASRIQSSGDFTINPNIDIVETAVENNVDYVSFYLSVSGNVLQGEPTSRRADTVHIFIDVDRSYGTGYQIRGIGADFVIEVYGMNGDVAVSRMMRFDANRDQTDWNGWLSPINVQTEVSGQNLETQVHWPTIWSEPRTIDALFHTKSWNGHEDYADFIESNSEGTLLVRQMGGVQSDVLTGADQALLEVNLFAVDTDIEVQSIEVTITGTAEYSDVTAIELLDLGGTPVSQRIWMEPTVVFDTPITIDSQSMETYLVVVDIASTNSGNTIGADIANASAVTLTSGAATIERVAGPLEKGYIGVVPSDIVIDGGFADWLGTSLDSNDEPETGSIQSIDMRSYDAANDNTSASFYLKVDEEIFGGTSVPYSTPTIPTDGGPVIIDSDRDSVPDNIDGPGGDGTRPFDFDNDGVMDAQTGYDYDGDGEIDHPFGPDEWLQTTIPADYPAAYANVTVTIFIGERVEPPILGEDTSLVFIDTNETSGTGYSIGPVFTEYMIHVKGKNGHIISSELFEHTGTSPGQYVWSPLGTAYAGIDYSQLEVQVPLTSVGLAPGIGFGAYFYTAAWSQAGDDYSDDALSNITTRSISTSRTRHDTGAEEYGPFTPDGYPIDDSSGGTQDSSKDGWLFSSSEEDPGTRASYQVDTSTSSDATAYSHQRKLIHDGTYWWAFYYNGTETVYEYSSDGSTWSNTAQQAFNTTGMIYASLWYNDTGSSKVVYIVGDRNSASRNVYVKRGTISGTTITWGTESTVTISPAGANLANKVAFISQDDMGYLWIVSNNKPINAPNNYNIAAVRSSNVDDVSSWGTRTDLLSSNSNINYLYAIILPLSSQDMYAMWYRDGNIEGKAYDGSTTSWDSSATSIGNTTSGVTNKTISAVVDSSDSIHLVYANETGRVNYTKYTSSWSSPTVLDSDTNNEYVTITIDSSTDDLFAFWVSSNYQIEGQQYTTSWSAISGIETNTNEKDWLTSVYNVSSRADVCSEWTQGTSSPYDVRFEIIPEFSDLLAPIIGVFALVVTLRRRRSDSSR
jgi:hypothetical protein